MWRRAIASSVIAVSFTDVTPALAQRFPFERTFETSAPIILDVSTVRGTIDVTVGDPGRVVVTGTVTVRVAWDVPHNAIELAKKIAAAPPIRQDAQTITLRPPSETTERNAVTVAYEVRVPPTTTVLAVTESGATTVRGVNSSVTVKTQSAAVDLQQLGGVTDVSTGSGAVAIDGVAGALKVTTSSSGITARALGNNVRIRTQSGLVVAELTATGDADVETGSSAIRLRGARGAVHASSQSGHIEVGGAPNRPWTLDSGSSAVDLLIDATAGFGLEAITGSGSINVEGLHVAGSVTKRNVSGKVGTGGPPVRVTSRSGSIRVRPQGSNQLKAGPHSTSSSSTRKRQWTLACGSISHVVPRQGVAPTASAPLPHTPSTPSIRQTGSGSAAPSGAPLSHVD